MDVGVEPNNAFNVELTRSTVRQSSALALVQLMANHALSADALERIIGGPLRDADRYIQGLITEGLARTPVLSPDGRRSAIQHLAARRWNATTSR